MFGFFKKKEEKQEPAAAAVGEEYGEELKTLGAKFRPEEMSILAVTGANGFGGRRVREDGPWIATLELTAWTCWWPWRGTSCWPISAAGPCPTASSR